MTVPTDQRRWNDRNRWRTTASLTLSEVPRVNDRSRPPLLPLSFHLSMSPVPPPSRSRRVSGSSSTTDRVTTRDAAPLVGCTNAETFAIDRWSREQPCDRNGQRIVWPSCHEAMVFLDEVGRNELTQALTERSIYEVVNFATLWRVPYLTTAQMKKRSSDEQTVLRWMKVARIAWSDQQYLRVTEWGGLKRPGGEWQFGRTKMTKWFDRLLDGAAAEGRDDCEGVDPDVLDREHEVRVASAATSSNRNIVA